VEKWKSGKVTSSTSSTSSTFPLLSLFFLSGISGLIYQVVWVRVFGNVFGNTIYSAALVVAVFMMGLGVGSYVAGTWSDRRYAAAPESLLRTYAYVEFGIGALGLGVSLLLPYLASTSALVSAYSRDVSSGWYALSTASFLARTGIALVLLTPITLLMGGTLTLLIRHVVRRDVAIAGWRVAALYGVNTGGAALGCFLTDFALVPALGLRATQMVAVCFNVVAGLGAMYLGTRDSGLGARRLQMPRGRRRPQVHASPEVRIPDPGPALLPASLALAMSGFAAMGMEILWFRYFSILLGGFRAVFALLLTIILFGIGAGSFAGGLVHRRWGRPADGFVVAQGLFVATALLGLGGADFGQAAEGSELWFNATPMLLVAGVPALLMGFSFPLANGIIQRAETVVGHRAGILYLSNTLGAVCGSLAAGFLFLPMLGMQNTAGLLAVVAGLAALPLCVSGSGDSSASRVPRPEPRIADPGPRTFAMSLVLSGVALTLWSLLPANHLTTRAMPRLAPNEQQLTLDEGLTEVIAVTEAPATGRVLLTNGHSMSSTSASAQRYMRALAHVPLLSIDRPETVLVIGFGVGNTTHAATLHPSIRRVEVADLSKGILGHAGYFSDVNRDVLADPRVAVYVNDGRHHLQMQPAAFYDLITLEPPPPAYAGMAALYSTEFYALARARLKPAGYVSQWLPAYQLPTATTLAMIRAFIDVFPQAVLLSGAEAELLLLGTSAPRIEIDPARVAAALSQAPAVQADLRRVDLGSVREIVGTFVGSPETLAGATRMSVPVTDDRPIQEYGVRSLLNPGEAVPGSVVDVTQVAAWCPACGAGAGSHPAARGLDTYLALLDLAYRASPAEIARTRRRAEREDRRVAGSGYLGRIVPESADLHNVLGIAHAADGRFAEAVAEFRAAVRLEADSAAAHWHLGAALASLGARDEAVVHLRRSVQLDPDNEYARNDLSALTGIAARP
jgi:spermidine synthase